MTKPAGFEIALSAFMALWLGGCASYQMTKPAPQSDKPIAIRYSGDDISAWSDVPEGTYHVPDSQVIISGHQKVGAAGAMFGLIGVAVAHTIDKNAGKSAVKSADDILHLSLTTEAQQDLKYLLDGEKYAKRFTTKVTLGEPELSISGSIVMTFVDDVAVVPFVVLKATLSQHSRNKEIKEATKLWSTRYICSLGSPRPLDGEDGWTHDAGADLQSTVSAELKRAITYLLKDMTDPVPRDDGHRIVVSGYYPFIKGKFEVLGYGLGEVDDSFIFAPRIGDASVVAGVAILDKSQITVRDAPKDDKAVKRL